jgi:cysteine-rich repeat protein
LNLTNGGAYTADSETKATSPMIDLKGLKNVRLQYRRWLGVEDSFFDTAKILANGTEVWVNRKTAQNDRQPGVSHVDREWRFQDVDLSTQSATGAISLEFALKSDPGLEFGGWTLDDVCIVTADAVPGGGTGTGGGTCGNGTVEDGESCDDGNTQDGDTCTATCTVPGEPGAMDGNADGGCCSSNQSPVGVLGLGLGLMMLVGRRRRA